MARLKGQGTGNLQFVPAWARRTTDDGSGDQCLGHIRSTHKGPATVCAYGTIEGRKPASPLHRSSTRKLYADGKHTIAEIASGFGVSRQVIYRALYLG